MADSYLSSKSTEIAGNNAVYKCILSFFSIQLRFYINIEREREHLVECSCLSEEIEQQTKFYVFEAHYDNRTLNALHQSTIYLIKDFTGNYMK